MTKICLLAFAFIFIAIQKVPVNGAFLKDIAQRNDLISSDAFFDKSRVLTIIQKTFKTVVTVFSKVLNICLGLVTISKDESDGSNTMSAVRFPLENKKLNFVDESVIKRMISTAVNHATPALVPASFAVSNSGNISVFETLPNLNDSSGHSTTKAANSLDTENFKMQSIKTVNEQFSTEQTSTYTSIPVQSVVTEPITLPQESSTQSIDELSQLKNIAQTEKSTQLAKIFPTTKSPGENFQPNYATDLQTEVPGTTTKAPLPDEQRQIKKRSMNRTFKIRKF